MKRTVSPICLVFVVSFAFGLLQASLETVGWQDSIEHGEVLAGRIVYPVNHPIGLYYSRAYSLPNHLSAVWLKAGFSERSLACFWQALKGGLLYAGVGLCTLAVTSRVTWSIIAPVVSHAFPIWKFTQSYPITSINHPNTNAFVGLAALMVALGLLANDRRTVGGFALGVLPYLHASLGAFGWACGAIWWFVVRPPLKQWIGFGAGAAIFGASYLLHQHLFVYPSNVPAALSDYYYYFYTLVFDYHRIPLTLTSAHSFVIILTSVLAGLYFLRNRFFRLSPGAGLICASAIAAVVTAIGYSVIASFFGLMAIPRSVLLLMPGRLANLAVLLCVPLLFGIASRLRADRAIILACFVTASGFVVAIAKSPTLQSHGWDESVSVLVWLMALSFAILLTPGESQGHFSERAGHWISRFLSDAFWIRALVVAGLTWLAFRWIKVFPPTMWFGTTITLDAWHFLGLLVLAGLILASMALASLWPLATTIFLRLSRQPWAPVIAVLLIFFISNGSPKNFSIGRFFTEDPLRWAKEVELPEGQVIPAPSEYSLNELQAIRPMLWFFDARTALPYVPAAGPAMEKLVDDVYGWHQLYDPATWGLDLKARWEARSPAEWQSIAEQYSAQTVAAPGNIHLDLPVVYRSAAYSFYLLPHSSATQPGTTPAFDNIDTSTTRYFFLPRTAWFSHGWYPLEVNETLTSSWAWLEKRGQIGVYVGKTADYYLHAEIAPCGEQRVTIAAEGQQASGKSYALSSRDFPAFSAFTFDPIHLKAGFNVVDVQAQGKVTDVGANRMASIAFKNVRWEPKENASVGR